MKTLTKELWFETRKRREFINITPQVADLVRESGVQEGLCLVNAMHITASVFINDDEGACTRTLMPGSKSLPPMSRFLPTATMWARTTRMPT